MGSRSDWETLHHAADTLEQLGVPHEVRVVSAHRTPDLLFEYASGAEARGPEVLHRFERDLQRTALLSHGVPLSFDVPRECWRVPVE